MVYLLLWMLFMCNVECAIEHFDHGWYIQRQGEVPEREAQYDCRKFGILCSQKNCRPFALKMRTLPTEDVANSKTDIINAESPRGDLKLLCLSNNLLRVTTESISGIIQYNGSLHWAAIIPQRDGNWKVERLTTQINDAAEKRNQVKEQKGYQISHELACEAAQIICDKNLKSCIQNRIEYPYLTVDVNIDKFNQIAFCDDKGKIEGEQCTEVLCSEKGGYDDDSNNKDINIAVSAIIKCQKGNKAHPIYYHKSQDRWCLSKYEFQKSAENDADMKHMSLLQMLEKQVVDKSEIDYLLRTVYDPKVQSYWFWGDAEEAINDRKIIPSGAYNEIQQKGLIDWKLTFEHLNTQNYKNIFKEFRRCTFAISEKVDRNKNCNDKTVTPWDLLQLAIIQGVSESASKQTTDVPKIGAKKSVDSVTDKLNKANKQNANKDNKRKQTGKLKPDDLAEEEQENKGNNYLSMSVLFIVIPILLIIMSGVYVFYI